MEKKLSALDIAFNKIIEKVKEEKSKNNYDDILKELFSDEYSLLVNNTLYVLDVDNKLHMHGEVLKHETKDETKDETKVYTYQIDDETKVYTINNESLTYQVDDETKVYTKFKTISLF